MAPQNAPDKIDINQVATVFVCITCGQKTPESDVNGLKLRRQLQAADLPDGVRVQAIKCFGACNHSCAVGVTAPHKVGYLFGNLDATGGVAALREYLPKYMASGNGVVARADRPDALKDILIRLPNPEWMSGDGKIRAEEDINPQQALFRQAVDDV